MRVALLCLLVACGGTQIQEPKPADVGRLGPATLEATKPKEGDPREAKVRVWVDAGVRATKNWKEDITEQIDYAGQLLTPLLGVRLKVDAFKDWDRTGNVNDALADLAAVDDGKEAIWVIGYVTPGDTATKAMNELGDAHLLGKQVVVRGWAETPETAAIAKTLPDLSPALRNEVISAHRRHKQTVVLLHMLARTLGAIGESDPTWIANRSYSPKQKTFADRTRDLMQSAIDHRLADDDDKTIAKDLLEKVLKEDWGGWVAGDRDDVTTQLTAIVNAGKAQEATTGVPVAALEQFERIKTMAQRALATMRAGKDPAKGIADFANAMAELDNLLVAYPANGTIYMLKCELLLVPRPGADPKAGPQGGVQDKAARAACDRVSELAPGDPSPQIALATAYVAAKDIKSARAELKLAAYKIEGLKTGAAEQWKRLVAFYNEIGSLTWTEEVVAQAKLDKDPLVAQIATTRARYGVPRGAKFVKPEDEAALVSTVREALNLVYASKYPQAEKAIVAGEKKWPGAPALRRRGVTSRSVSPR